jgi:hypothetical protein
MAADQNNCTLCKVKILTDLGDSRALFLRLREEKELRELTSTMYVVFVCIIRLLRTLGLLWCLKTIV